VKRACEPAEPGDGRCFLVERLWPWGIRKTDLPLEAWLKDVAPNPALRTRFAHDPAHNSALLLREHRLRSQ
jgi:uncharacterized protein YeaO (DUF488 family)